MLPVELESAFDKAGMYPLADTSVMEDSEAEQDSEAELDESQRLEKKEQQELSYYCSDAIIS